MSSEKKKILIIDDSEEICDLMDITFRGTEFKVFKAFDGREGIQVARKLKPDVILLDDMMPGFDGFMICRALKRNPITSSIPIIFLTSKKFKDNVQAALRAGVSDYIVKPFSPSDLLMRLRKKVKS